MKYKKRDLVKFIFALTLVLIVVMVVLNVINYIYVKYTSYSKLWNESDLLLFSGAIIGAIGTIFLGYIANKQNKQLLALQERSQMFEGAYSATVSSVKVFGFKSIECNFNLNGSQFVYENKDMSLKPFEYATTKFTFELENIKNIPIFVKVTRLLLYISSKTKCESLIDASNSDDKYSLTAFTKCCSYFEVILVMEPSKKQEFIKELESQDSNISLDIEMELISGSYVKTKLLCRADSLTLEDNTANEKTYKSNSKSQPLCFCRGYSIENKESITVKPS